MWEFSFLPKSVGFQETNAFLGCINLKMRLKSSFGKTKTTSMSNFHNEECAMMLTYVTDVFCHLNDMNLFLHGRDVTATLKLSWLG